MPADRNLDHLYPAFRAKIEAILEMLGPYSAAHMPGYEWKVSEGYRTAAYQNELYQKGRTTPPLGAKHHVTDRDGYVKRSDHQSGLAADIDPYNGGGIDWHAPQEHWAYLGHCAKTMGMEWGGDFKKLGDFGHVQWPEGDKETYAAAHEWEKEQGRD